MTEIIGNPRQHFIERVTTMPKGELQKILIIRGYIDQHKYSSYDKIHYSYDIQDKSIGWASLYISPTSKSITWDRFYPLENYMELRRKGIGTLATFCTIVDIAKIYPGVDSSYSIGHSEFRLSEERQAHLKRIGISHGEDAPYEPIASYLSKLSNYAAMKGFILDNPFDKSTK